MRLQNIKLLVSIPDITHRQLALYEVEGLQKLELIVTTTQYGSGGKVNPFLRFHLLIKNAFAIKRKVRKEKIDLVYLNTAFDKYSLFRDFVSLFILRLIRSKIFLKIHGSDANLLKTKKLFYSIMIRKFSSWADGYGVLSKEEKQNFVNAGFRAEKVFVVKNIVKPEVYLKKPDFRIKYVNFSTPILLFVARLIPTKGLLDTLGAAIILKEKGYVFKLIIVGDGPERSIAERIATESNITSFVFFSGFIPEEETKSFYANCDIMIFPTYHEEGFPMTVFQSVAAGLPIITTRIRASADYLVEPVNCLWVEPKNPEMLAEKIAFLLENNEVSSKMAENNRQLSFLFTQEIVCKELELIFKKILELNKENN